MIGRILLIACVSLPAIAADIPQGSGRDGRIQYTNYHSGDVFNLYVQTGIATRVVFGADETITAAASGFTDGYDIDVNGRVLTLQPLSVISGDQTVQPIPEQWQTNLAVQTDKRFYDFDVNLIPANHKGHERVAYRVEFRYPVETVAQKRIEAAEQAAALEKATPARPIPSNILYTMQVKKGSEAIAPVQTFDDGNMTYIQFKKGAEVPAAFIMTADGETVANSHTDPNDARTLIIHRVVSTIVLRLGSAVVSVHNNNIKGITP